MIPFLKMLSVLFVLSMGMNVNNVTLADDNYLDISIPDALTSICENASKTITLNSGWRIHIPLPENIVLDHKVIDDPEYPIIFFSSTEDELFELKFSVDRDYSEQRKKYVHDNIYNPNNFDVVTFEEQWEQFEHKFKVMAINYEYEQLRASNSNYIVNIKDIIRMKGPFSDGTYYLRSEYNNNQILNIMEGKISVAAVKGLIFRKYLYEFDIELKTPDIELFSHFANILSCMKISL